MTERDQILKLIEEFPKTFSREVRKIPHLLEWIENNHLRSNDSKMVEKIYSIIYQNNGICQYGNIMTFHRFSSGFKGCGGNSCKCKLEKTKQTNLNRYGSEYVTQATSVVVKIKQSNLEKYGVEYPFQSDNIQDKVKQGNLEKYGVDYPLQSNEIWEKTTQTVFDRYGVKSTLQLPEVQDKIKQTLFDRYGVEHPIQNKDIFEQTKQTNLKKYGTEFTVQSSIVQEKAKQTNLDRYGTEYATSSEIIKDKIKQTNLDRYGVEHLFQLPEIQDKIKQTILEKYGVEHPVQNPVILDKIKQTNLKKYGVEYPLQSDDIQDKIKQTILERYGVISTLLLPEVQDKIKQTNLERYGVENPLQSITIREKLKRTNLERYGTENPSQSLEIQEKIRNSNLERYGVVHITQQHLTPETLTILNDKDKFIEFCAGKHPVCIAEELKCNPTTIWNRIRKYNIVDFNYRKSSLESKLMTDIVNYPIKVITNTRKIIAPLELDFYFPEHNFAIEINGIYWHSELTGNKSRNYHYNKFIKCQEQNIHLYQYFDDEFYNSYDLILSKIKYLTNNCELVKIGARHIKDINDIPFTDTNEFLLKNHIQKIPGKRNVSIGAYYNNQLIAVFVGYLKDNTFLLSRYANDINYSCPGLFSKLLKFFITRYNFKGVITTYSDNRHSNGNLYAQTGFIKDGVIPPGYSYTNDYFTRLHCSKFRKEKIQKNFGIDMSNKTEWQAMQELGYDRIWDAGKLRWIKNID